MSPVSLLPILPIILLALGTMRLTSIFLGIRPAEGRFASIDGLRGYMAFFVFLHHSCIWFYFTHGTGWHLPPSNIYSQFGSTSVAIFFMITSFLFFTRLLQASKGEMDWVKLYISRGLRIMPLYLFALFVVVCVVAVLSQFTLQEPFSKVLGKIAQWLAFMKVDINGLSPSWLIIAGVVWSLPYEWLFYFMLPFLGLLLKVRVSQIVLAFALAGAVFFLYVILQYYWSSGVISRMMPFLSGITAAFLVRAPRIRAFVEGPAASFCIAVLLAAGVYLFPDLTTPIPLLLVSAAFIGIACGNDLFGILTHSLSRQLGQVSYSVYLLHGIVLFITFTGVVSFSGAAVLTPLEHWGVIAVCAVAVVCISSLTYVFIERRGIAAAPGVTERWKKRIGSSGFLRQIRLR